MERQSGNKYIIKGILLLLFFGVFALNVGSTFSNSNYPFLIILLFSAVMCLIIMGRNSRKFVVDNTTIKYAVFVLYAFASVLWSTDKNIAFTGSLVVLLTLVVIFIFHTLIYYSNLSVYELLTIICVAGLMSFGYLCIKYGISIIWSLRSAEFERNSLYNANGVGRIYAVSAISGWISSEQKVKKSRILRIVSFFLFFLTLLTGSRTNLFFTTIFFIVALYLNNRGKKRASLIIIIPMLLYAGYIAMMSIPGLYNTIGIRMLEITNFISGDNEKYTSTWYRYAMIKNGIFLFVKMPMFGYGMANAAVYNKFEWTYESGVYLHSNVLELLVDIGIIGICLFYRTYFSGLYSNFKYHRIGDKVSGYFIALIIAFLITDMSSVSYLNRTVITMILVANMYGKGALKNPYRIKEGDSYGIE